MDARLAARGAGGYGFTGPTAGLFMAMQGAPGVSMMSIGRDPDGMLRATLAAAKSEEINIVLVALQSAGRSEEHTSELQSLMRISYAVFCLKKKKKIRSLNETNTCTYPR